MNKDARLFENYPVSTIVIRNLLNCFVFLNGFLILLQINIWCAIAYIVYCFLTSVYLIRLRCTCCYYFGKSCCSGFGKIAKKIFRAKKKEVVKRNSIDIILLSIIAIVPIFGAVVKLLAAASFYSIVLPAIFILLYIFLVRFYYIRFGCAYCKNRAVCAVSSGKVK
jgi:hypothetical protein